MPIARLLEDSSLTPEQRHVLELAFKNCLRRLNLTDRNDPLCNVVAERMIKLYERGVTNPVALTEITIREIGPPQ